MKIILSDLKFKFLQPRTHINKIILHCTANTVNTKLTVYDIHKLHLESGWSGIGYHFVIKQNGDIYTGRPENAIGSHCSGYNSDSLGIAYLGGIDSNLKPLDSRTENQKHALYELVEYLCDKYSLTINDVYCHNNFSKKDCPSFKIETFRNEYTKYLMNKDSDD